MKVKVLSVLISPFSSIVYTIASADSLAISDESTSADGGAAILGGKHVEEASDTDGKNQTKGQGASGKSGGDGSIPNVSMSGDEPLANAMRG